MLRTDIFQRAIPWARLIRSQRSLPKDLNLRFSSRVSGGLAWVLFASLMSLPWWPTGLFAAAAAALALLALNAPFYRFLLSHRGLRFTLGALPWHWLYYLYATGSFAYVMLAEGGREEPMPRLLETHGPDEH